MIFGRMPSCPYALCESMQEMVMETMDGFICLCHSSGALLRGKPGKNTMASREQNWKKISL